MHQYREIAPHMVAVGLAWACRIEVPARVYVDDAGLKSRKGNVTRMRQHIVPIGEGSGMNRIRRGLESTKSSAHQIDSKSPNSHIQNCSREEKSFEYPHVGSESLLSNVLPLICSPRAAGARVAGANNATVDAAVALLAGEILESHQCVGESS